MHRRLSLYFAGKCRYEPQGMTPAYRPDLSAGWLDIRAVEARVLARSRLAAAVLTGTLGRSRVYRSWLARSVERVPAPEPAGSSGPHQPSDGVQGGAGAGAVPKVRRTMTKATATMAAASPET
jgi:hypothetical protein